ncbi:MAG: imidazole glycerol phosphate synthase subunit HisH [Pseudomonadota bacterium]
MERVAIVDYGMGNLRSVAKAVMHVAAGRHDVIVTEDATVVRNADRVVFPGQGAIGDCMRAIQHFGLEDALAEAMAERPFLGICIGLQALFEQSEEDGGTPGLGYFRGKVTRFSASERDPTTGTALKIPHMGWNQVRHINAHPMWSGIESDARFYFVHSFFVEPDDEDLIAGTSHYGETFTAAIANHNIFAVQFHPEKSQRAGLQMIENFLMWEPR